MYFVSPTAGERFYLRCLLTTIKGVTSWKELRTVDGTEYATFHATCLAHGLLENDDEWRQTLLDASLTHVGQSLRRLFCLILRHCVPSKPHRLWEQFRQHLCDDLCRQLQCLTYTNNSIPDEDVYDYGLFLINDDLCQHGLSLSCFPSMPPIRRNWSDDRVNRYLLEQITYNRDNEHRLAKDALPLLNRDQRVAFDTIYASACADNGITFFVHGPGGTGKTFLYNTLCHCLRANGSIVLCVASSGIAALLLPGGHTAHSTFAIPVQMLCHNSCCQIEKHSPQAEMLHAVKLIIWDEAVTQHRLCLRTTQLFPLHSFISSFRHAIEAVDCLLQDIRSTTRAFGGITVVFGGDFQQTLPVVAHGSCQDIVQATLQCSHIWDAVHILHLRQNMRVFTNDHDSSFAEWLLHLGHDRQELSPGSIDLPLFICCKTEDDLIKSVYGSFSHQSTVPPPDFFTKHTILAARNADVHNLNSTILDSIPGDVQTFTSADSYSIDSPTPHENNNIPLEFLHTLNASGLPVTHLSLKLGCPIILLRNINTNRGLCNGTRATVVNMSNRLLEVRLLTRDHAGENALIPRITLSPSPTNMDFAIKLN